MTAALVRDADLTGHSEAVFSADGTYRYLLVRRWDRDAPPLTCLMLNPSTADALADDPTLRRVLGFARREGAGTLNVVNLFALRATDPRELARHPDPVGPHNDEFLRRHCAPGTRVLAGWGAGGQFHDRASAVAGMLRGRGAQLVCLGTTASGEPRHPLYVRADTPLATYGPVADAQRQHEAEAPG
jgi:hypothetical protein